MTYQADLDKAVDEIRNLQVVIANSINEQNESDRISLRLKNRRAVDMELREVVNELSIKPSMVNTLISVRFSDFLYCQGEMYDDFFVQLAEFGKRLDFVDCVGVDVGKLIGSYVGCSYVETEYGEGD